MAVARMIYNNLAFATGVVVTAQSAETNRPASYVTHPSRTRRWKSTLDSVNQWVALDFLSAKTFSAVALVDWQNQNGANVRAQTSVDGSTWVTWGTFPLPSPNPTGVTQIFGNPTSTRYFRILFEHTGGAAYASLGVVFVGEVFTPTRDIADMARIRRVDPSYVSQSQGGQEYVHSRAKYFQMDARWPSEEEADETAFRTMFETVGSSRPMIVSYDSEKAERTYYARMTTPYEFTHELGMYHSIPFGVQEVR
jgi:hypothetical protein